MWDACVDLYLRWLVYSSLGGAFGGVLIFRSPVTQWASVAFGAGIGIESAYTKCSYIFERSSMKESPSEPSAAPATSLQGKN